MAKGKQGWINSRWMSCYLIYQPNNVYYLGFYKKLKSTIMLPFSPLSCFRILMISFVVKFSCYCHSKIVFCCNKQNATCTTWQWLDFTYCKRVFQTHSGKCATVKSLLRNKVLLLHKKLEGFESEMDRGCRLCIKTVSKQL